MVKKLFFLALFLALFVFPGMAFAQEAQPVEPTNLSSVLVWLVGVGGVMAVNWIFANVVEKLAFWNNLPSGVKWVVPPVLAVLLGFGANELLKQEELLAAIQPYWSILVTIVLGYYASQTAHLATKRAKGEG